MAGGGEALSGPRVLESRRPWAGRLVRVRVDRVLMPGGGEAEREVVEHPGAAAVLALLGGNRVVLVEQYRHAAGMSLIEVPAGIVEPGEDPLDCARRELAEETGYAAASWERLARFYSSPGFTDEVIDVYLARGLSAGPGRPEPGEDVRRLEVALGEALDMARRGDIRDGKTVAALYALADRQRRRQAAGGLE